MRDDRYLRWTSDEQTLADVHFRKINWLLRGTGLVDRAGQLVERSRLGSFVWLEDSKIVLRMLVDAVSQRPSSPKIDFQSKSRR